MCSARLIDAADTTLTVPQAYSAPTLRPFALTWCRVCDLHRCTQPDHAVLTFYAAGEGRDGVWTFRSSERWPEMARA